MSLIAPEVRIETARREFRLPAPLLADLDLYAEFIKSSDDYVVQQVLAFVFQKDQEFRRWRDAKVAGTSPAESPEKSPANSPASLRQKVPGSVPAEPEVLRQRGGQS